jgi:hypothetical protein
MCAGWALGDFPRGKVARCGGLTASKVLELEHGPAAAPRRLRRHRTGVQHEICKQSWSTVGIQFIGKWPFTERGQRTGANDRYGQGADASRQLMNDGCLSGRDTRASALGLERMTATGRTVSITARRDRGSNLGLFCHLERIVNLDAGVSNCARKFAMTKQQLYGPEIFCPAINQRCFGAAHRVRAVRGVVESN